MSIEVFGAVHFVLRGCLRVLKVLENKQTLCAAVDAETRLFANLPVQFPSTLAHTMITNALSCCQINRFLHDVKLTSNLALPQVGPRHNYQETFEVCDVLVFHR